MTIVKICGMTNLEDALAAAEAGADLLGFILYPKSPRYVTPETVAEIVGHLRRMLSTPPRLVGVFVNATPSKILKVLRQTGLDLAQLHGDEPVPALAALQGLGFKAMRPTGLQHGLTLAAKYAPLGAVTGPSLLIDAYAAHTYGGTGERADWYAAAAVAKKVDRLLLAGGLTPENVALAVDAVKPWGVDVASGVEQAPGRKDHATVKAFIAAAKGK